MGRLCSKELLDRRLRNSNQAHLRWTCIRLENKLERNYSLMGQERKGNKQLKVTSIMMKVVLTLTVIWLMMNLQDKSWPVWEPLAKDAISPTIRSMAYINSFYLLWFWMKCNTFISKLRKKSKWVEVTKLAELQQRVVILRSQTTKLFQLPKPQKI